MTGQAHIHIFQMLPNNPSQTIIVFAVFLKSAKTPVRPPVYVAKKTAGGKEGENASCWVSFVRCSPHLKSTALQQHNREEVQVKVSLKELHPLTALRIITTAAYSVQHLQASHNSLNNSLKPLGLSRTPV